MNAVDYVLENVDALTLLEHYGFEGIYENGNQIRCKCKIHGGDNPTAFHWNKENNLWCCYTGDCGGGDAITLVQKMEHLNFVDAVKKLSEICKLSIDGMEVYDEDRLLKENKRWLVKESAKQKESIKEYVLPKTKQYYTCDTFQRFSEDIIKHYGSYFTKLFPTEEYMLYNKLVIPIKKNNKTLCVALRDTSGISKPKWFYYPAIKMGTLLYNIDTVKELILNGQTNEIILVEGIFDVWAYHRIGVDNVVAVFGSSLKEEQKKELLKLGADFILSFDNDDAGNKCKQQCKRELSKYADIYIVALPKGKDPADCTEEELKVALSEKEKE